MCVLTKSLPTTRHFHFNSFVDTIQIMRGALKCHLLSCWQDWRCKQSRMSGRSSNSSVAEMGSPADPVQTYDIPPKRQALGVENSYDTPRSTRIWDTSRPSSVVVDGSVYDSPRSTRLVPSSEAGYAFGSLCLVILFWFQALWCSKKQPAQLKQNKWKLIISIRGSVGGQSQVPLPLWHPTIELCCRFIHVPVWESSSCY